MALLWKSQAALTDLDITVSRSNARGKNNSEQIWDATRNVVRTWFQTSEAAACCSDWECGAQDWYCGAQVS